ncbi:uncharacterized protein LOC134233782 [Saccostrea cucullata]|uniref:uncharacterized protein LOC134233782 n=1 Tax=Saccostrea cuccullata TaxID=36930 RepID=UPI002ED106F9
MAECNKLLCSAITAAVSVLELESLKSLNVRSKRRRDDFVFLTCIASSAVVRDDISKIDGYVERIIPGYLPEQFKRHFRLSRETFECILNHLANFPTLQRRQLTGGRLQTTLEKDLMMLLWYLGTQETVRSISDRFDVQESTLILHNRRLIDVFSDLCKKFVKWPNNEEKQEIMSEFEDFSGFPGVIGAIDGTHISITPPGENEADYVNRKSFHSIILQAVCRHDRLFIDINCGWPGRVNDARVFRNSEVFQHQAQLCGPHHLVGDGAYPLSSYLMKPYRESQNMTAAEKMFNKTLCRARAIIEHAFGVLKGRFRRLQHINMVDIEYIVKTVVAACVLHNICIINHDELGENFETEVDEQVFAEVTTDTAEGNLKRLFLTRQLSNAQP